MIRTMKLAAWAGERLVLWFCHTWRNCNGTLQAREAFGLMLSFFAEERGGIMPDCNIVKPNKDGVLTVRVSDVDLKGIKRVIVRSEGGEPIIFKIDDGANRSRSFLLGHNMFSELYRFDIMKWASDHGRPFAGSCISLHDCRWLLPCAVADMLPGKVHSKFDEMIYEDAIEWMIRVIGRANVIYGSLVTADSLAKILDAVVEEAKKEG